MRRLVIWGGIFVVLWALWWAVANATLQWAADTWIEELKVEGWQASAEISQSGFPMRLQSTAKNVELLNPVTRSGLVADGVTLRFPTYWPGFATLTLPETPISLTLSGQEFRLRAVDASAGLRLHPGTSLQLESVTAISDAWLLSAPQGALLSADDLGVFVMQDGPDGKNYAFDITSTALTPGDALRGMLGLSDAWPRSFDSFAIIGAATFDIPLDRNATQGRPPQPRAIELYEMDVRWGALELSGWGALTIDESGVPTGDVTLQLANWQQLLDLAAAAGILDSSQRNQAQLLMGGLANIGGGGPDLDLTLKFANGQMALGPVQLGPAPRIIVQ